ncbi:MAG: PIN domain-containing protein [Xanthomonadales bacterium]|nr:PIN domain-containing protein [Xanthomonadales bacterium]
MTHLLDGNVLVALVDRSHVHHPAAVEWFAADTGGFATCPITQGTLIRLLLRFGAVADAAGAVSVLAQLTAHPRHTFWGDDIGYADISWAGVLGHRQVTDSYLAGLARHHQGRLATFDRGLAALHTDIADAIGV